MNITVTVPTKLVSMFNDTIAPRAIFGLKAENIRTKKPKITTTALKLIALPECAIVSSTVVSLFFDLMALILYRSIK